MQVYKSDYNDTDAIFLKVSKNYHLLGFSRFKTHSITIYQINKVF